MDPFSFGLSAGQSVLNFGSNMLQNYHNKQMAQYQNDWNLEMWNRQNEYNSPRETMNRLVDAGINPRAYQQIGQFANAGQPQPAAPRSKISELSAFQSVARQGLENELLSEKVKQAKEDTHLKGLLSSKAYSDNAMKKLQYIITSLTNGMLPDPTMIAHYIGVGDGHRTEPAYLHSDLYKYIQSGTTTHPYLRKGELGNLLQAAGVDLRKFESALKEIEIKDYDKFGIRGNSDWVNLGRYLGSVLKRYFNIKL